MGKRPENMPIGEQLRHQRIEKLGKGLREMAKILGVAPAHLTDIETGHRNPSEELLVKMAQSYQFPEAELRAAYSKPEAIVHEIASNSATEIAKVPHLLRATKGMSAEEYDKLIEQVRKLRNRGGNRG